MSAGLGAAPAAPRPGTPLNPAPGEGPASGTTVSAGAGGGNGGGVVAAFLAAFLGLFGLLWTVHHADSVPTSALVSALEVPGSAG